MTADIEEGALVLLVPIFPNEGVSVTTFRCRFLRMTGVLLSRRGTRRVLRRLVRAGALAEHHRGDHPSERTLFTWPEVGAPC